MSVYHPDSANMSGVGALFPGFLAQGQVPELLVVILKYQLSQSVHILGNQVLDRSWVVEKGKTGVY